MRPNAKKWFAGIGVVVVAIIAALIIFGLRYAAPEKPPVSKENDQSSQRSENKHQRTEETQTTPENADPERQETPIEIKDSHYQPALLTVKRGTTVKWTNHDSAEHSVTADEKTEGGPDSGLLAQGESYSTTFDTAGEFHYHCTEHEDMSGVVQVVD